MKSKHTPTPKSRVFKTILRPSGPVWHWKILSRWDPGTIYAQGQERTFKLAEGAAEVTRQKLAPCLTPPAPEKGPIRRRVRLQFTRPEGTNSQSFIHGYALTLVRVPPIRPFKENTGRFRANAGFARNPLVYHRLSNPIGSHRSEPGRIEGAHAGA